MGTGIANALGVQWGQMTPSQQVLSGYLTGALGGKRTRSKTKRRAAGKKKAARVARKRKTPRRRAAAGGTRRKSRLVKGSAAAKRYMAKIRRMRKR